MALHVSSRQRSTSVAFGAKRTLTEPRLQKADYEYTARANSEGLFPPARHRPFELGGRPVLRPHRFIRLALKLDEVGRRQRILAGVVEFDAVITDHELLGLEVGFAQRRLDLRRLGRARTVDGIRQDEEALHPARAGIVEIAAEFGLEHLVDLVGIASGLADVPGAAIDRALRDIADVGDESRIGEAGIVADDDRRQVVEILERLEIEDRVRRVADEDAGVGLQLLELENLTGDIRAVGVVGNLRADIDAGAFG